MKIFIENIIEEKTIFKSQQLFVANMMRFKIS